MTGPMRLGRRLVEQTLRDDILGLAAELAYRFFLALFPFAIFLAALGGSMAGWLGIADPAQWIVDQLASSLPPEASTLLVPELRHLVGTQHPALLSLGALFAVIFATSGTNALIKALDRTIEVRETRPLLRRYALAVVVTILGTAALILAAGLVIAGEVVATMAADASPFAPEAGRLAPVVGFVLSLAIVTGAAVAAFRVLPNRRTPIRDLLPGAVLGALGWFVMTAAFGFYVTHVGRYALTFGALAGVAIALIWFYLSALILLAGAELNDVLADLRAERDASPPSAAP
jgi:membrane protein